MQNKNSHIFFLHCFPTETKKKQLEHQITDTMRKSTSKIKSTWDRSLPVIKHLFLFMFYDLQLLETFISLSQKMWLFVTNKGFYYGNVQLWHYEGLHSQKENYCHWKPPWNFSSSFRPLLKKQAVLYGGQILTKLAINIKINSLIMCLILHPKDGSWWAGICYYQ